MRATAARELAAIGPDAKDAAPALVAALQDEDRDVRRLAAWALRKIERSSART